MYRAGLEWILGFRVRGALLYLDPCIPRTWPRFEIVFRYHSSHYHISVDNPQQVTRGVSSVVYDGELLLSSSAAIPLIDDNTTHQIHVILGTEVSSTLRRAGKR